MEIALPQPCAEQGRQRIGCPEHGGQLPDSWAGEKLRAKVNEEMVFSVTEEGMAVIPYGHNGLCCRAPASAPGEGGLGSAGAAPWKQGSIGLS